MRNLATWETETQIDYAGFENAIHIQKEIGSVSHDLNPEQMIFRI